MKPDLELANGFNVSTTGRPIPFPPRYSLSGGFVTASPHTDFPSHEVLLSETFGSTDWLWSGDDEFRFGKHGGGLRGMILAVPEQESAEGWSPERWLETSAMQGGLQSITPNNFDARPTEVRWVEASGDRLVCAFTDSPTAPSDLMRLRVAPNLDIIFADHVYSGWILENPAAHLVQEWEPAPPTGAPEGFGVALRDYLTLFVEPRIGMMQDGDTALLAELDSLLARLATLPVDQRRTVIQDQVSDLRERWYGE
ncbi:hypothetical protein [Streptomyces sp. NPDC055749]